MAALRPDGSARRDALLDAAQRCFARHGVFTTGIEEIRAEAKASPSSVYHLFPDGLPELTAALLVRTFQRLFSSLEQQVRGQRSAKGVVEALVGAHLDWVLAHRAEARVMYQAVGLHFPPRVQRQLEREKRVAMRPLLAHFAPWLEAGALPAWEPELLDVVLLGATHEACRRVLAGAPFDVAWLRETLPALAWRTVRGNGTSRRAVERRREAGRHAAGPRRPRAR